MIDRLQAYFYRSLATNVRVEKLSQEGPIQPGSATASAKPSAVDDFGLDARLQAKRMGSVYELLYCLENSIRELIERTLREDLGPEKWWTDGVPEDIRRIAEKRKLDDAKARWHGPRGESLVNYVDFPQYGEIILAKWALFEDLIGDRDWLENYFDELNRTRRALAHTGTLTDTDVERMEFRVREWLRVVG